jgi:hypothetical protein
MVGRTTVRVKPAEAKSAVSLPVAQAAFPSPEDTHMLRR